MILHGALQFNLKESLRLQLYADVIEKHFLVIPMIQ